MVKNGKKWYVKNPLRFSCTTCDYSTSNKKDFEKHCETIKHKRGQNGKKNPQKSPDDETQSPEKKFVCETCNRSYKYQSGYSRHKVKCVERSPPVPALSGDNERDVIAMLKETTDTNSRLCAKIMRLEQQTRVINTTIHNNQKVNLNVFLNTQCKDAMNMSEFIDQLKLTCEDLMYTKDNGYIKGITNIFVKNLEEIDMNSRPIHCSNSKKQQFFIKNKNRWEEDVEHEQLDSTIDSVAQKQIIQIKDWEKANPNWESNEEGTQEYMRIIQSIMGGKDPNEREKNRRNIKINLVDPLLVEGESVALKEG